MQELVTTRNEYSSAVIKLPAVISLSETDDLKNQLLESVDTSAGITIDGSNVQRIDTAGLQLLTAFAEYICSNKGVITWHEPTRAITEGAELLGLSAPLKLDNIFHTADIDINT